MYFSKKLSIVKLKINYGMNSKKFFMHEYVLLRTWVRKEWGVSCDGGDDQGCDRDFSPVKSYSYFEMYSELEHVEINVCMGFQTHNSVSS